HREDDVVQVGDAAVVGVVGREHVARLDAVGPVELDDPLDGLVEDADEGGDAGARGGEVAGAVGDGGAHVEDLVDDRAHRRLAERGEHLVADRLQRALDDLQRDRGGRGRRLGRRGRHGRAMTRSPYSSTAASFPGWTTTVAPFVSTIAGPGKLMPGS